jgi:ABC-type transport system substrate-binding protein
VREANVIAQRDERARLYRHAQRIMYEEVPLVRLADVKAYVPVRRKVEGFRPHFLGAQPYGGVSLRK